MAPTLLVPGNLSGHPAAVPVEVITDWLKERMPQYGGETPAALADRVIIVKSKTGSGKSTVLPAHVFRLLRNPRTPDAQAYNGPTVLCTQPRVLTAVNLARDMASSPHYADLRLPDKSKGLRGTVGHQTGPITHMPPKGLVYATAGTLRSKLRTAVAAGDYSAITAEYGFIIVDEAHERSLDIDAVLMLIKQLLKHGVETGGAAARNLPFVILASATIDVNVYAKFFELPPANVFQITGRQFPIETRWPATGCNNYIGAAADPAAAIHTENPEDPEDQRDVLVFMPGARETRKAVKMIEKQRDAGALDGGGPVLVLVINREVVNLQGLDYTLVGAPASSLWSVVKASGAYTAEAIVEMEKAGTSPRRIIVATVVAETGLTISTLRYVIDTGWNRTSECFQPYDANGLITRPAAQTRILQRKGRCGRLFPGVFYPMYTKSTFDGIPENQMPDIVTEGMTPIVLDVVLGQQAYKAAAKDGRNVEFRAEDLDMVSTPPADAFSSAVDAMTACGFFSAAAPLSDGTAGYGLTRLGILAAKFSRVGLAERRLLLAGPLWTCSVSDLATVCAVVGACGERGLKSLLSRAANYAVISKAATPCSLLGPALLLGAPGAGKETAGEVRDLLCDDLLEGLLLFEAYRAAVESEVAGGDVLGAAAVWCEEHSLNPRSMLALAAAREGVLEEMVAAGLNPFWGESRRLRLAPPEEFASRVRALKRCAYDAYRANELAWDAGEAAYVSRYGLEAAVDTSALESAVQLLGAPPAALVTPRLVLWSAAPTLEDPNPPLRWTHGAALVSVLEQPGGAGGAASSPELLA
jgi:hypothetical protein